MLKLLTSRGIVGDTVHAYSWELDSISRCHVRCSPCPRHLSRALSSVEIFTWSQSLAICVEVSKRSNMSQSQGCVKLNEMVQYDQLNLSLLLAKYLPPSWTFLCTDPAPCHPTKQFPFCFPAFLHCYAPVFVLQEVVNSAEVYVTYCDIAYISSMLQVISSILDGLLLLLLLLLLFFFNCFLVPPSIMRVVSLTCSRYYHQLWILPLG